MKLSQEGLILGEVIDKMADKALAAGGRVELAIELFSAGVDRLVAWLPVEFRLEALEKAKSHGYCTPEQILRMREEGLSPH